MQLQDTVNLILPARAEWTGVAAAAAGEYATRLGFPEPDSRRICLALEEAALDAIGFGYGGANDELRITLSQAAHGMHMTVRSRGLPLEEASLPRYDPARLAQEDTTGLSSFLIRKSVDEATFALLDGGEREVSMLVLLPKEGGPFEEAGPPAPAQETTADGPAPVQALRQAGPDDAEAIARLALRSHGTVMFDERIYYPASVREMLESGEMISVAVETAGFGITGHGALLLQGPGLAELTFGFVDRRFRGHGCTWGLAERLMETAAERGVRAVIAMAVTSHVRSQRSALHAGLRECALLAAASPAAQVWQGDGESEPGRIGNLVLVRYLGATGGAALHVPARHRRMVEAIRANLGLPATFAETGAPTLPDSPSRLEAVSDCKEGWMAVTVAEHGRDIHAQIEAQLRLSRAQGIPATHLLLPLDSPATPAVSDAAERLGFFFAGIGPGPDGRDYLVLQRLSGVDPGYESIQVHTPFGRELLEYVRSCDPGA